MTVLISAILPIALVALVGVVIGRTFELDLQTLARVGIYGMLPALIFQSLSETTVALESAIALVLAFLMNTSLLYVFVIGLSRILKLSQDHKKSLIATTLFANVGNMGLPFVLFALGEAGLARAVIYLVSSSLTIATVFPIVLQGAGIRAGIQFTLKLPVLWAALIGIGLQVMGKTFPFPIHRGITLLGNGAIPLALLTLGIQLSRTPLAFGPYELFGTGLRLIISPLLAYNCGQIVGLEELDLQVLVLQSAMPVAVNSLVWVTELGGDRDRVARTVVLSTFLSLLTLPIVLWLLR